MLHSVVCCGMCCVVGCGFCCVKVCACLMLHLFSTELEGGLIEICEGFMGPPLFSIDLQSLRANNNVATDKGGLVFFGLSEFGGKWRCRTLESFCSAQLPALMKLAKARK